MNVVNEKNQHNVKFKNGIKAAVTAILMGSLLAGCGDSSDDDGPDTMPALLTGIFIDSPVEGLNFKTGTHSGTTNSAGEFNYQLGDIITFSIGGITFPSVVAEAELSPLNIFATTSFEDVGVINMSRLLQSLDTDGNADNGITLDSAVHTLAANLSVDFTSDNFDTSVSQLLIDNNAINISLISSSQAIDHLKESLMVETPSSCGSDHASVGFTSSFSTIAHDVTGDAEIIDNCTIKITNFNYDATAPAVYFYGDTNTDFSSGFIIGEQLRDNRSAYQNDTITLTLPSNKTLDDVQHLSVWCVDFSVNFGDLTFSAP